MTSFPQQTMAVDAEVQEDSTHRDGLSCSKPQKRFFTETLSGDVSIKGQEKPAKRLCSDESEQGYGSVNSEHVSSECSNAASSIVPRMQLCALEETLYSSEDAVISTSHCPKCLAGHSGHLQHMLDSEDQALMDTS